MQVVKAESTVPQDRPYLKHWDETARKHFLNFESMRVAAAQNLKVLRGNLFTSWRTVP